MRRLAACLVMFAASPCHASYCIDMSGLSPLESSAASQKPIRAQVEALLHDAETIYAEGAHIVARKPNTEGESIALSKMESLHSGGESFHIKECNFQDAFYPMLESASREDSADVNFVLTRIGQFDTFIFQSVNEALSCSNRQAEFDLTLSRQLLDHAWMEFKGHPEERDWDPADLLGPQSHERCIDDLPLGISYDQLTKIIDDQIRKFQQKAP